MPSRNANQFRWHMKPQHQGAFTAWRLSGAVPTAVPGHDLRPLIRTLWFWSGWPIELVVPVAVETAPWLEWWSEALAAIPEDHLTVRWVAQRAEVRRG